MKNIHILPTDKPSRLHKIGNELGLTDKPNSNFLAKQQNLYITSDEEIKEGDWYLINRLGFSKYDGQFSLGIDCKKIILTTDPDLIKDGVQPIDDEFLEWFVKNPSCEEVEVDSKLIVRQVKPLLQHQGTKPIVVPHKIEYKIIIPKEEPKQETPEEAAEILYPVKRPGDWDCVYCVAAEAKQETPEEAAEILYPVNNTGDMFMANRDEINNSLKQEGFIDGAKWMQERRYSEEDMKQFGLYLGDNLKKLKGKTIDEIFEQFKKK